MKLAKLAFRLFPCARSAAYIAPQFRVSLHRAVSLKIAGFMLAK
jgi:hypothetical protein